jgi:biopolymer transport protein ExbB
MSAARAIRVPRRLPNPGAQAKVRAFDRNGDVWEIIQAAGWPIWPLIFTSVIALAIIGERAWSLRNSQVAPPNLLAQVVQELQQSGVTPQMVTRLNQGSPLARILASGLRNARASREIMRESIEETGRAVAHELERFLTTLGTIASMSPLLGLFGTTIGMIEMFSAQTSTGLNPVQLAHGISIALYNTAFGLVVAIPSMIFYRHYRAKVTAFVISMEQQAVRLVDIVHGARPN